MSRTRSLLDLPNELIIDILSDAAISQTDIFIISCVSKRLNALALPIYLAAHDIPEPEREISLYVLDWGSYYSQIQNTRPRAVCRPDTLSGLNVSTNISQVKHFKCFFQDPTAGGLNSVQRFYHLPLTVERTARFVHRLKYVGIAEIYLIWDPYYVCNKTFVHVSIPEFNEWTESFCSFLNIIVERGCTSLTVQYDAPIELAFRFRSSNSISKTFSSVFQYVHKRRDNQPRTLQWELKRSIREGKVDPSRIASTPLSRLAQESNSIVTLSLHSNALLLPPFVNWTLSLLYSHSSLTCITFGHLTFPEEIWTTVLPLIADAVSDRLTKLSFFSRCTNFTAENLMQFLGRLPHLTHLSVDRLLWSRFQLSRTRGKSHLFNITPPYLPQLQVLQAPTELVTLLLTAQPSYRNHEVPASFPQLRSLIVYPCTQLQHPGSYSESSSVINALTRQIKNQSRGHEVEYALDLQKEFTNFASSTQDLQSQASEQRVYRSLWDEIKGVEVEQLVTRQYDSRIVFLDITRVVLYPHHSPTSLSPWLKLLFPHLKTLVFTCQIAGQPDQVSLDARVVDQLIKELATACPTVHTLVVGKETYKLGEG